MNRLLAITLLLLVGYAQAGTILLHDASSSKLRSSQKLSGFSPAAATAALCAATALVPPYGIDGQASKQVESVVQRDVFQQNPKAVVLLHVAGMSPDSDGTAMLKQLLGEGNTVQLTVQDDEVPSSAGSLLQAASDVISVNPDVTVNVLDHSALQGCHPATCLSQHLSTAVQHCGGRMHQQQQPQSSSSSIGGFSGQLELPGLQQPLDMSSAAARLFGLELAGLQGATQQALENLKQQQQEQDLAVYESTFVGLQGLQSMYSKGSSELAAAESALVASLGHVAQQLREAYNDNVLFQVTLLGEVPVSSGKPSHLLSWKELSRRVLLERAGLTLQAVSEEPAGAGKAFANKATAYAVMLILIWFTFAGVYCMVAMKFKQDTLLYGRSKSD